MLGCGSRITGRKNRKNYYVRKTVHGKKVMAGKQCVKRQDKLPEVIVEYNPYDKLFSLVEYFCPICNQKLRLGYSSGCINMVCHTYGEEYILNIRRIYD